MGVHPSSCQVLVLPGVKLVVCHMIHASPDGRSFSPDNAFDKTPPRRPKP